MKKLLSLSSAKIYLFCGLGLLMTLGSFWHYQMNQTQLERMGVLNNGVATCFTRVSQTFTAMMIKDIRSPYLNRGFMGLSDECLNETIKGINPFRRDVGKGYETLNQLISEVHWFHEKVLKIHAPMLAGRDLNTSIAPLTDRFAKMESFKETLMDEIDASTSQVRELQINDEIIMGIGLVIFVLSLTVLSLQEFNRIQLQKELEREALNFLNTGKSHVGAIVDKLVDRALLSHGLPVTAQIFRDYHEDILEKVSLKLSVPEALEEKTNEVVASKEEVVPEYAGFRTSLKEVLVSIQNLQPKETVHIAEVRDVQLNVAYETFEQMMSAAVNQLAARRMDKKKVMISNQIHSDRSIINLFLGGGTFTAAELEFSEKGSHVAVDAPDMNLVILKEMVEEAGAQWYLENKTDRSGNITGMNIRFTIARAPKERSRLVSVVRGKKKDLRRELMN